MSTKVNRVRRRTRREKRKSPFFSSRRSSGFLGLQAKLSVGKLGDKYEMEADAVADKVVNHTESGSSAFFGASNSAFFANQYGLVQEKPLAGEITPLVQKLDEEEKEVQAKQWGNIQMQVEEEEQPVQAQVEEEEEAVQAQAEEEEEEMAQMQPAEEEEELQAKQGQAVEEPEDEAYIAGQTEEEEKEVQASLNGQTAVNPYTESKLKNNPGSGNKLDTATRNEMESGFGADFRNVNIHTDSTAEQMSKELGAQAFTHGNDIYFNKGKYNPQSREGKHLLAHELTHTIQQSKDPFQLFRNGEANAKSGNKGLVNQNSDNTHIQRKTYDPKENLQSRRFSGNSELELVYDGKSLVFNGSAGETVTVIQNALVAFGYPLKDHGADGIFGSETEKAVRDFQTDNNATMIDGIVGPETMRLLDFQALKIEKNKKKKKEEENIDEVEKTILEKVEEELKKGSDDKRPEYALCLLNLYKAYRSHQNIYDKYMPPAVMEHYIKSNMGQKPGNTFKHPGKLEKSSFANLDMHVSINAVTFLNALLSETKYILKGISKVYYFSKIPLFAMLHEQTLEFLQEYINKRMKKPNDIYSCFR